ncbi:MAG: hypothetical protein Kow00121_67510 [Elainellaceae cyanobacterium]
MVAEWLGSGIDIVTKLGGAIAIFSPLIWLNITCAQIASAQVVPDDTLRNERSIVNSISAIDFDIEGGARRGDNLFHSFREFNVEDGGSVYFANADGISRIITRVTGNDISDIDGILGVLSGNADLFLLNPNGIIFGDNARLDIGGSFFATTADAIQFGDQGFFSAINPEAPALLTISPSAFFFNQITPGDIASNSVTAFDTGAVGLQVPNGETLALLGGNVTIDGGGVAGGLNAWGGRVEIGAVAGTGPVALNSDSSLTIPQEMNRADVVLTDGAKLDVVSDNGGDIAITARTINITAGSQLLAGSFSGLGSETSQAGNITLNASQAIDLEQASLIQNSVSSDAIGTGGNINITTGSLSLANGSYLDTSTYGQGDAGNIIINAREQITLANGAIIASESRTEDDAGDIFVTTDLLSARTSSYLSSSTYNSGNAGDVVINARTVNFDGTNQNDFADVIGFARGYTGAYSTSEGGSGNGQQVIINTDRLIVSHGAEIATRTFGTGNAGDIEINAASQIRFDGGSAVSRVEEDSRGQGGNITISTGTLDVLNGASLEASTFGVGNAGNVTITARDRIRFDNGDALSTVGKQGIGQGGNVNITTGRLEVLNRAQLTTSTFGLGDAGSVTITARDQVRLNNGNIFSTVETGGIGDSNGITITTGILEELNGARLAANTSGQGDAGNIIINAREQIILANGAIIVSESRTEGDAGDVLLMTDSLFARTSSYLSSSTYNSGNAGDVIINARTVHFDGTNQNNFADIIGFAKGFTGTYSTSESGSGDGGRVILNVDQLFVNHGAEVTTRTFGQGDAGDIIITAQEVISLTGVDDGFSSTISTGSLYGNAAGQAGNIRIRTPDFRISNGAIVDARTDASGQGGDIVIHADTFTATDGGQIITRTQGSRSAGSITLNVADDLILSGRDRTFDQRRSQFPRRMANEGRGASGLFANTRSNSTGNGGSISVSARNITLENEGRIVANSQGQGEGGAIRVQTDTLSLADRALISTETQTSNGGNIALEVSDVMLLRDRSNITTEAGTSRSGGNGGNMAIAADFIVAFPDEDSNINANAFTGNGGNIAITTQNIFGLVPRAAATDFSDITASSEFGLTGEVEINSLDIDPSQGLVELPAEVVDASQQITQTCSTSEAALASGAFVITGQGGLPPNPTQRLTPETVITRLAELNQETQNTANAAAISPPVSPDPPAVEAHGWVVDADGNVVLLAQTGAMPIASPFHALPCRE